MSACYKTSSRPTHRIESRHSLTHEVVEAKQRSSELTITLHDDPYARSNTSVNQLCNDCQENNKMIFAAVVLAQRKDLGSHASSACGGARQDVRDIFQTFKSKSSIKANWKRHIEI